MYANHVAAGARPQTPLGELTALPRPPSWLTLPKNPIYPLSGLSVSHPDYFLTPLQFYLSRNMPDDGHYIGSSYDCCLVWLFATVTTGSAESHTGLTRNTLFISLARCLTGIQMPFLPLSKQRHSCVKYKVWSGVTTPFKAQTTKKMSFASRQTINNLISRYRFSAVVFGRFPCDKDTVLLYI